jgi:hypothetical protein
MSIFVFQRMFIVLDFERNSSQADIWSKIKIPS